MNCPACGVAIGELIPLTRRQRDIIPLIAENLSNKEIAVRLGVEERTIQNTVYMLRKKLKATSRMNIVELARMGTN